MTTFAGALAALMAERGISGRDLARRTHCDPSLICRYKSGKKQPSEKMAGLIDEVLGAKGALVALARREPSRRAVLTGIAATVAGASLLGALDGDERDRLGWAQRHPPRIDAAAVASLAAVLAGQRHADDSLGSAAMRRPALAQLATVESLVRQAPGALRPAVLDIGMQWAQFGGWLCRNTADWAGARGCAARALEWATELGDRTMITSVLAGVSENRGKSGLFPLVS